MLKRFFYGLAFGAGFGIAILAVWIVGARVLLPRALGISHREPKFENPQRAEIVQPNTSGDRVESRDFSFFKGPDTLMGIPENGGLLSMASISTPPKAKRPNTYQLWLTHSELWQIRTVGEKAEVEKLPYPKNPSAETLDSLMSQQAGFSPGQATMSIPESEINDLKSGAKKWERDDLNGKLKITVQGVVFVLPNPYKT